MNMKVGLFRKEVFYAQTNSASCGLSDLILGHIRLDYAFPITIVGGHAFDSMGSMIP